ncbi:Vesicle transport through interaction with t-SNAREs-like protein 1A [Anas platyrhynchos]|uniref:Vesicle transport through interaction with t-SNAREs-like protein 1A n=1 Tax=Anas platyrhynchos TaxID=8839 RepID=R0LX88_ANAPL|nr:Vesicle transport through interaction with t-SNAREs-like protein 1A [Anas platyrhynchos]
MLENLSHDREKIQRARERLRETDANLGKSSRILTGMLRRFFQNILRYCHYLMGLHSHTCNAVGHPLLWLKALQKTKGLIEFWHLQLHSQYEWVASNFLPANDKTVAVSRTLLDYKLSQFIKDAVSILGPKLFVFISFRLTVVLFKKTCMGRAEWVYLFKCEHFQQESYEIPVLQ